MLRNTLYIIFKCIQIKLHFYIRDQVTAIITWNYCKTERNIELLILYNEHLRLWKNVFFKLVTHSSHFDKHLHLLRNVGSGISKSREHSIFLLLSYSCTNTRALKYIFWFILKLSYITLVFNRKNLRSTRYCCLQSAWVSSPTL